MLKFVLMPLPSVKEIKLVHVNKIRISRIVNFHFSQSVLSVI